MTWSLCVERREKVRWGREVRRKLRKSLLRERRRRKKDAGLFVCFLLFCLFDLMSRTLFFDKIDTFTFEDMEKGL